MPRTKDGPIAETKRPELNRNKTSDKLNLSRCRSFGILSDLEPLEAYTSLDLHEVSCEQAAEHGTGIPDPWLKVCAPRMF